MSFRKQSSRGLELDVRQRVLDPVLAGRRRLHPGVVERLARVREPLPARAGGGVPGRQQQHGQCGSENEDKLET